MGRIELVVFDMAGTTIRDDGNVRDCLIAAAEEHAIAAPPESVHQLRGISKVEVYRRLLRQARPGLATEAVEVDAQRAHATYQAKMLDHYRRNCLPMDGAEECFAALRERGIRIATDTGFGRPITDAIMDCLGWRGRFVDADLCVDDVPGQVGRPAPYMLFRAMERLGVTSVRRVAKVGDTVVDLQEGTNAGCALVIGVLSGSYGAAELGQHPHTHLLESVRGLPALLDRWKKE